MKKAKSKPTKVTKPAVVRPKVTKTVRPKKAPPVKPQEAPEPVPAPAVEPTPSTAPVVEEQQPQPPQSARTLEEIPAEGNNIASAKDRAFGDTADPNMQPPVEKTFVPEPDAHTVKQ